VLEHAQELRLIHVRPHSCPESEPTTIILISHTVVGQEPLAFKKKAVSIRFFKVLAIYYTIIIQVSLGGGKLALSLKSGILAPCKRYSN